MKKYTVVFTLVVIVLQTSNSIADVVFSEIDVSNNKIELVNIGSSNVDLSNYWLCNRVNGSPFYAFLTSSSTIDVGLSTASSYNMAAGEILVIDVSAGFLPDANGELGLFNTNSFGSSAAIDDYVLWGANGIRDIVAQNAGIWNDNDSIDVSGMGVGETIQLSLGQTGNSASEYFVGASSLGTAQSIPEPSTFLFLGLVSCVVGAYRWKKTRESP